MMLLEAAHEKTSQDISKTMALEHLCENEQLEGVRKQRRKVDVMSSLEKRP